MKSFFNTRYGHIETAYSYPSLKLMKKIDELHPKFKDKEVIVICYGGGLSLMVADILLQAGFVDVKSLHEGTDKWNQLSYPTVISNDSKE
jgi:rhodanese-related sulfurtransferase